jgi:hypothetical protein
MEEWASERTEERQAHNGCSEQLFFSWRQDSMFPWMGCDETISQCPSKGGGPRKQAHKTVQSERERKGGKERQRKIRRFVVSYRSQWGRSGGKVASFKGGTGCLNR